MHPKFIRNPGYPKEALSQTCSDPLNPHCMLIEDVQNDPVKDGIYSAFVEYFQNPVMTKTASINNYAVYRSEVPCQLAILKKYLVAYVLEDGYPINSEMYLSDLPWVCFQTETSERLYQNVRSQGYARKKVPVLEETIRVLPDGRQEHLTRYQPDNLPLRVELIPKNKDKKMYNRFEYAEEGTIRIALETFHTSITWR